MCEQIFGRRIAIALTLWLGLAVAVSAQPYYPSLVVSPTKQLGPGTTWRSAVNPSPAQRVQIIEIDLSNPNIDLVPVHKLTGALERTSSMAARLDGIAAVNSGFFNTSSPFNSNSYTLIDGTLIAGNSGSTPRSVFALWGNHNEKILGPKVSGSTSPAIADWSRVIDAQGGRGNFTTSGGVVVDVDEEATGASHAGARHPRTVIGWNETTRRVWLVTIDGRNAGVAEGMTFTEIAQLMADLGIPRSISLDGGGSTTAWVKGVIVNDPSDGSERSVVSSWVVVPQWVIDNTSTHATVNGTWATATDTGYYDQNTLVASGGAGANSVTFTPDLELEGVYKVYAWWAASGARSTAVDYSITHRTGTATATVNQQANGGAWNLLGTYAFNAGTGGSVTVADNAVGSVSADAVKFVRTSQLLPRWQKNVGDFPWFANDSATRSFALNPATANALVGSTTAGGGIHILSNVDGTSLGRLGGSLDLLTSLELGGIATTRTGKIFSANLVTAAGTDNHRLRYWTGEGAATYATITGSAPGRVGDSLDAFEDPDGNITVLVAGNQAASPPVLLRYLYNAGTQTWTSGPLTLSGLTLTSARYVTIRPLTPSTYEIWMKATTGTHRVFSSAGAYLRDAITPGTSANSNAWYGVAGPATAQFIASGPYSGTGPVSLYDLAAGFAAESVAITLPNANSNASGRYAVAGQNGKMVVLAGVTNNFIAYYDSGENSLALPASSGLAVAAWDMFE